jgi:hypothetical protein
MGATHSFPGLESHSLISFSAFIEREDLMKRSGVLAASVTRKNRITRSIVGIAHRLHRQVQKTI